MAEDILKILGPRRRVVLDPESGASVLICRPSITEGLKRIDEIRVMSAFAMGAMEQVKLPEGTSEAAAREARLEALELLLEYTILDHLDLVRTCLKFEPPSITLEDCDLLQVGEIVKAWLQECFGNVARLRPWAGAVEKALQIKNGAGISLSEIVSNALSQPGIGSKTSSIVPQESIPTKDGA